MTPAKTNKPSQDALDSRTVAPNTSTGVFLIKHKSHLPTFQLPEHPPAWRSLSWTIGSRPAKFGESQ